MNSSNKKYPDDGDVFKWKRMQFKGNKVWLALANETAPLMRDGKVKIKYNLSQPYEYWVFANSVFELGENNEVTPYSKTPSSPEKEISQVSTPLVETPLPHDCIQIYTDGASSGNPGPSGVGVVMLYGEHRKEISKYIGNTTNNIAELAAIQVALDHLKSKSKPVVIYTDSSYAVGVLVKGWKAKKNRSLIEKIRNQIAQFSDLSFVKVAGHAGITENERADQLAVQAISSNQR